MGEHEAFVGPEKLDAYLAAKQQILDLQRALAYQRALTEQERRRADLAEASRDLAWKLGAFGGRVSMKERR